MKMGRTAEGQGLWEEVVVEKLRMDVDNGEGILAVKAAAENKPPCPREMVKCHG